MMSLKPVSVSFSFSGVFEMVLSFPSLNWE